MIARTLARHVFPHFFAGPRDGPTRASKRKHQSFLTFDRSYVPILFGKEMAINKQTIINRFEGLKVEVLVVDPRMALIRGTVGNLGQLRDAIKKVDADYKDHTLVVQVQFIDGLSEIQWRGIDGSAVVMVRMPATYLERDERPAEIPKIVKNPVFIVDPTYGDRILHMEVSNDVDTHKPMKRDEVIDEFLRFVTTMRQMLVGVLTLNPTGHKIKSAFPDPARPVTAHLTAEPDTVTERLDPVGNLVCSVVSGATSPPDAGGEEVILWVNEYVVKTYAVEEG